MTSRRAFLATLAVLPASALAQRRLWRIGYHSAGSAQCSAGWLEAFRKGMSELGWSEDQHYVVDARYADGDPAAAVRIAAELAATKPDVVLTTAETSIAALARFTTTVPIVFAIAADPVGNGYAASPQRPAGNLTGVTGMTAELAGKRLDLLTEAFPRTAHVLVLFEPSDGGGVSQVKALQSVAARVKVRLTLHEVRHLPDIDAAFDAARTPPVDACVVIAAPLTNIQRKSIAARLLSSRIPSISSNVIHAEAGLLMSYAPSVPANFRRAAVYVDEVLIDDALFPRIEEARGARAAHAHRSHPGGAAPRARAGSRAAPQAAREARQLCDGQAARDSRRSRSPLRHARRRVRFVVDTTHARVFRSRE